MFTGVDEQICASAWDIVLPAVTQAAARGVTNRLSGAIVVLDPRIAFSQAVDGEAAVIFSACVGTDVAIKRFSLIARAKAMVSWRTGQCSRVVQQDSPHLYVSGDTKWGGSVVRHGLIVAFSGVQAEFDEMIAGWLADAIIALCRYEMTKPDGVMQNGRPFLDAG